MIRFHRLAKSKHQLYSEKNKDQALIFSLDEFFPLFFKSRKFGNDICFIMMFFRISVRKTSGENSHCNEEKLSE